MTGTSDRDALLARFVEVCRADDRVVAAFLGGSHVRGDADAYSDLDLCIVVTDAAYADVVGTRPDIVGQLGEPLFCEDFGNEDVTFFILADGTEGELNVVRASALDELEAGPHRALLDDRGILPVGFAAPTPAVDLDEALRQSLSWFWHELSHFVAAVGRDQPWWAMGQLEALRGHCVALVRIAHGVDATDEPYEKLDTSVDTAELDPVRLSFVPLERAAILEAGLRLVEFYRDLAPRVAARRGTPYPAELDRLMGERLEELST